MTQPKPIDYMLLPAFDTHDMPIMEEYELPESFVGINTTKEKIHDFLERALNLGPTEIHIVAGRNVTCKRQLSIGQVLSANPEAVSYLLNKDIQFQTIEVKPKDKESIPEEVDLDMEVPPSADPIDEKMPVPDEDLPPSFEKVEAVEEEPKEEE